MYIALSLVAGAIAVWVLLVGIFLLVGWRRKSLIATLKRLVKYHAGILLILALLLLDFQPCVTTPLMSTAEKADMQRGFHAQSDHRVHRISFTGRELATGLRSAAYLLPVELHSEIAFPSEDQFRLRFALGHPLGYLNGELDGSARIEGGKLETTWNRFRIGRIPMVGFTRTLSQHLFAYVLNHDPSSKRAIASIVSGRIHENRVQFEIARDQDVLGSVANGFQSRAMSEDAALAASIVEAWLDSSSSSGAQSGQADPFVLGTRFMFEEAQRRAPTRSAVRQNRAAILAAAIWMGHVNLLRVSGQSMKADSYERLAKSGSRVKVQGRNDLVRHFWVSAAITSFASARISTFAGISKEEMDSGEGGSGFSFCDLLADRAGVRFAELALGSRSRANAMQARVASDWTASDAIALVDGLPEGIRQSDFLTEYGGVDGELYRRWSDMIDQRIRSSRLIEDIP